MWLVDLKSGGEPRWLEAPAQVANCALSEDGRWLATGDTESYRFWKYGTWELKGTVPSQMGESQGAIAFFVAV